MLRSRRPLIAPHARRLIGVDLSEGMLDQARARDVYDDLVKRELTAYLRSRTGAFDVIVSADTLVYFGPLEEVVEAAAKALRAPGWLIFTVEELRDGGRDAQYAVSPNGRYRHARGYVEHVLADAGLRSEIVPAELRLEAGEPVPGLVVRGARGRAAEATVPQTASTRRR
jgi:predicted TPR repeat methyltransferase